MAKVKVYANLPEGDDTIAAVDTAIWDDLPWDPPWSIRQADDVGPLSTP